MHIRVYVLTLTIFKMKYYTFPCCFASDISVILPGRRLRNGLSLYLSRRIRGWTRWRINGWCLVVIWSLYLIRHHVCLSWSELWMVLLGIDLSTRFTITVERTTRTAEAGYDGNDDGDEDNWTDNSACISFIAPTTVWTNSSTTTLSVYTLMVVWTRTRSQIFHTFSVTAQLARNAVWVAPTGTWKRVTDASAITALLTLFTFVVLNTDTRRSIINASAITARLVNFTLMVIWTEGCCTS